MSEVFSGGLNLAVHRLNTTADSAVSVVVGLWFFDGRLATSVLRIEHGTSDRSQYSIFFDASSR